MRIRASVRLKATEADAWKWLRQVLGIDPGPWRTHKTFKVFTIEGADLPYFKAVDKITDEMHDRAVADTRWQIKSFAWYDSKCTVLAIPLDEVASSYVIATRDY